MATCNVKPRTMFTGDCLDALRGLNDACVDLIYLDPPFNSNHDYAAPIGSQAAGAAFRDTWTLNDIDVAWLGLIAERNPSLYKVIDAAMTKSDRAYLVYMAIRIIEMWRALKPTGSLYLHCDPTMSHWLKLLLDALAGKDGFRNEIVWSYTGWNKTLSQYMERRHDVIFFYAKSSKQYFNYPTRPWESKEEYLKVRKQKKHVDEEGKEYVLSDGGGGKRVRRYLDDAMAYGVPLDDVWKIPKINNSDKEYTGYPTQKPLALLERIIEASGPSDGLVLDPFCGCATACVAAEHLKRDWIGIDISKTAYSLVKHRMERDLGLFGLNIIHRTDIPKRTDTEKLPGYKTHKHELYGKQEGHCAGCQEHTTFKLMHVDHILAVSKGGTDHLENLQLLCGHCNSKKGSKSQAEFMAILKKEGIIQ